MTNLFEEVETPKEDGIVFSTDGIGGPSAVDIALTALFEIPASKPSNDLAAAIASLPEGYVAKHSVEGLHDLPEGAKPNAPIFA